MAANVTGYVHTQPTPQTTESIQGRVVYDATAIVATDYTELPLGFEPDVFEWHNLTDLTYFKWIRGMADGTALKTAANGTTTLIAAPNGFSFPGNRSVRVSQNATTAAIAASKVTAYKAAAN